MIMTVYDRQLISEVVRLYSSLNTAELVEKLIEMGVLDSTKSKVLVVREYVFALVKEGMGKVDAMYCAAEKFSSSYEYIRKCMYYYKDVNLA